MIHTSLLIYCEFNGKLPESKVSYVHQSWYKKEMSRSGVNPNLMYHVRNGNSSYIISSMTLQQAGENVKEHGRKSDRPLNKYSVTN